MGEQATLPQTSVTFGVHLTDEIALIIPVTLTCNLVSKHSTYIPVKKPVHFASRVKLAVACVVAINHDSVNGFRVVDLRDFIVGRQELTQSNMFSVIVSERASNRVEFGAARRDMFGRNLNLDRRIRVKHSHFVRGNRPSTAAV